MWKHFWEVLYEENIWKEHIITQWLAKYENTYDLQISLPLIDLHVWCIHKKERVECYNTNLSVVNMAKRKTFTKSREAELESLTCWFLWNWCAKITQQWSWRCRVEFWRFCWIRSAIEAIRFLICKILEAYDGRSCDCWI